MEVQIVKWGNGQGIRIPKAVLKQARLQIDDICRLTVDGQRIIIEKTVPHRTLEERAAAYSGRLGPYEAFDWGEPSGREAW